MREYARRLRPSPDKPPWSSGGGPRFGFQVVSIGEDASPGASTMCNAYHLGAIRLLHRSGDTRSITAGVH